MVHDEVSVLKQRAARLFDGSGDLAVGDELFLSLQVTLEDPTTWTRPWTAATTWTRGAKRMFEYACHEANYGMTGILAGARAEEKAAK